jgi:protein Mpv17
MVRASHFLSNLSLSKQEYVRSRYLLYRFIFLGNHFNYPSAILSLATKVIVNQAVFTPIFNSYFFGMQSFLSGDSLTQVWERIKKTVPISMVNSCKLWPAVTAFSFTFIGPQYRSIFAGVIAIGWQTYLSFLNRQAESEQSHESIREIEQEDSQDEKKDVKVQA